MAVYGKLSDILKQNIFGGDIKAGLGYLNSMSKDFLSDKPAGYLEKVEIDGQNLYALHQVNKTKSLKEARLEAHRKYIDLQYICHGQELITIADGDGLIMLTPYDRQKDVQFFQYFRGTSLIMKAGMLAVFYPHDAHAPGITFRRQQLVRKIVVKVKLENKGGK